jgi:2-iminobutanoate/2-iminopropanoate deaminase
MNRFSSIFALLVLAPGCVIYATHSPKKNPHAAVDDDGIVVYDDGKAERTDLERVNRRKNIGPFSDAVAAGSFLFLSGEIPRDNETGEIVRGDIAAATRKVMQNIGQTLKSKGLGYGDIAMVTIYLKDLSNYDAMNQAYSEFFESGRAPARATVQVSRLALDADMEVAVVAYRGD